MNEVINDIVTFNALFVSKIKFDSQEFLDELHENYLQCSKHKR